MEDNESYSKEIAFHDELADDVALPDYTRFFSAPTAMEIEYVLSQITDIWNKRILDIGCGTGEGALNFARLGAETSCCDIAPKLVEFSIAQAETHKLRIKGAVCPVEDLAFSNCQFDYVYMNGVLHHALDRNRAYHEIHRVLKPGGRFFAVEPLIGNPAIWIYRKMAGKMRSREEAPLTFSELKRMRNIFTDCRARSFWFLTQSIFMKYYLLDHIHPSRDRYWRRIYGETERTLWWWLPLKAMDSLLTCLPIIRRWAYTVVFEGAKCVTMNS